MVLLLHLVQSLDWNSQLKVWNYLIGYVNPNNTTLSFDVTINYGNILATDRTTTIRFQNNIQSLFSRVRLLYGATPIEDIIGYNQIVRSITEWTTTGNEGTITQQSINEGIGGYVSGRSMDISGTVLDRTGATAIANLPGLVNVRQAYIHGISTVNPGAQSAVYPAQPNGMGFGVVPAGTTAVSPSITAISTQPSNNARIINTDPRRRYQIQFALGLFNQPKLIPTKFMASQLAIEITLANPADCMYVPNAVNGNPSYTVSNVNLIPEILEFDASYGILN